MPSLHTTHYTQSRNNTINSMFSFVLISGYIDSHGRYGREDSSASDDGNDSQSTIFIVGSGEFLNQPQSSTLNLSNAVTVASGATAVAATTPTTATSAAAFTSTSPSNNPSNFSNLTSAHSASAIHTQVVSPNERLVLLFNNKHTTHDMLPAIFRYFFPLILI